MAFTLFQVAVKFIYIEPHVSADIYGNRFAINMQPVACQSFVERRERAAQGSASMCLVVFRPEQSSQGITALWSLGDCKVGDESSSLACINVENYAIAHYAR